MISPDLPIAKSSDDKLNRRSFSESLAQVLLHNSFSSSITIGLYGKWGSGKTSILNMVLESVANSDGNVVILRFNPWLCSDPKQLITQFFKQMASAIKLKKSASDHTWELIDQYADIFDIASLIPRAGTIIAAAGKAVAKKARKHIDGQANNLQSIKNEIVEKLKAEKLKIIVSIDDIDRLSEEEIISVFQLVKALADFPNTIYLLAFDYDVVVHALSKVQHGDGKEYLEKIIQIPFEIPAPSMASIHDALFSKLNNILGDVPEEKWDRATWAELFHFGLKEYIKSIRDVIRYTNVFFLKYELLKDETDPVDLLGLTCLQVFEPFVYSKLPNYKDTLCGTIQSYSSERQNAEEKKIREAIDALIPDNGGVTNIAATKETLGLLFPKIQSIPGVVHGIGRNYMSRKSLINNRISALECFDRYFSLTLENDAIPTATVKDVIYAADEAKLMAEIEYLYLEGKITRLLEEIAAYANSENSQGIPSERASMIIRCLSRQWHTFRVDDSGFLSVPFAWRLLFCVDPLLESMDEASRYPCICAIFKDPDVYPSTLALLLNDFEDQHGRFAEAVSKGNSQIITLNEVLELEQIFMNRAIEALDSGEALKQHDGLNFLWMLEQIDADLVARKREALVTNDISLVKVISYCTIHGTVTGRIVSKTRKVDQETLGKFIDTKEAYQRIRAFVTSDDFLVVPEEDQMNSIAFLLGSEKSERDRMMHDSILDDTIHRVLYKLLNKG